MARQQVLDRWARRLLVVALLMLVVAGGLMLVDQIWPTLLHACQKAGHGFVLPRDAC